MEEEKTNQKNKMIKGILAVAIVAILGAITYGIASGNITIKGKDSTETSKNTEQSTMQNKNNNESQESKKEIDTADTEEAPIDNYVEKLSTINSKGATKEKGEMSINGIKIGMTKEEVEKIIGEPEKIRDNEYDATAIYGKNEELIIEYNKETGKSIVYNISVNSENDKYKTDRGIKVGDKYETVISKYAKEEKVEPYEKAPNIYMLYGKDEIETNEDEGIIYSKSKQSQYAMMYGFYDNGKDDICLIVSYSYGENSIEYFIKDGKVTSITIGTAQYTLR